MEGLVVDFTDVLGRGASVKSHSSTAFRHRFEPANPTDMTLSQTRTSTYALILSLALALLGWSAFATPAWAQEEAPEAQRYENVDWHEVNLVDFKPGKTERAMEIISDYFQEASKRADTQVPRIIEMQTGPWDLMLIWTMEEGPSEMTWKISPEGVRYQEAFNEVVGSEEEAEEIVGEYYSLVARETSYVGMAGRHGRAIAER